MIAKRVTQKDRAIAEFLKDKLILDTSTFPKTGMMRGWVDRSRILTQKELIEVLTNSLRKLAD